ncbi:cell envelope integrity protein TolA [Desulfobacter latus]|uniref:Cell envelope integrity protein TolA n=1 Tax=Desulfobacter latus TaxID=2292 RepID=A0A850TD23_9BACT|nr:cell envelope integrity protein TolA [Desulfobacter latus]NWH06698.1 cell envelope integrity protein TolA [Desulfobacter latus]
MNIRSQIQNKQRFISESKSFGPGRFFLVCLLSLVCHALFFISLYFLHDFQFSAPSPKVVTVDLVTFAPGPAGPANAQTSGKAPMPDEPASDNADNVNPDAPSQISSQPVEPKAPEIPIIKPEVSLKSKPQNLKDLIADRQKKSPKKKQLKKKPPKEKPVEKKKKPPKKARKKLEKDLAKAKKEKAQKLEKQKQTQLKDALARMKDSVASRENDAKGTNFDGKGRMSAAAAAGAGTAGGGGGNLGEVTPLRLYQMVIKSAIEQNWVFNDVMAGLDQDLEVRIFIKILKNGNIRDISFETRSGNNYLDESAKKAIKRANPLPELPKGMFSYELVLGFSPRGLK